MRIPCWKWAAEPAISRVGLANWDCEQRIDFIFSNANSSSQPEQSELFTRECVNAPIFIKIIRSVHDDYHTGISPEPVQALAEMLRVAQRGNNSRSSQREKQPRQAVSEHGWTDLEAAHFFTPDELKRLIREVVGQQAIIDLVHYTLAAVGRSTSAALGWFNRDGSANLIAKMQQTRKVNGKNHDWVSQLKSVYTR